MGVLSLLAISLAASRPAAGDDPLASEARRLASDAPLETFTLELPQWEALVSSRDPQWVYRRYALRIAERPEGQWEVRSHAQGAWSAERLAAELGDEQVMGSLRLGRELGRIHVVTQASLGAVACIGAVKLWMTASELLPDRSAYRADPRNYDDWDAYQAARDRAQGAWDAALAALPQDQRMKAEDQSWTGIMLAVTGTALLVSLPLLRRDARQKDLLASRHFSREQTQALLDERNARLARQLVVEVARMRAADRALPLAPLPERPDSPAAHTVEPR